MSIAVLRRFRRSAMGWAHAMLLVSLLLGVGGMHTLGHVQPEEHSAGSLSAAGAHGQDPPVGAESDLPPMDATSVCLAIGGFAIALLGLAAAVFTPWPGTLLRPPSWIRWSVMCGMSPEPPSLAQLQVLRV